MKRITPFAFLLALAPATAFAQAPAPTPAPAPSAPAPSPSAPAPAPSPSAPAPSPSAPAPAPSPSALAPSPSAPAPASDLLVPTPPAWKARYDAARAKLITGQFAEAATEFAALEQTAANRFDRALAHAQGTLASEWSARGLTFVERSELGETGVSAKAVDRRTTDELVSLYTNSVFYGIGSGVALGALTEPKTAAAAILPTIALTGASVGTIIALDSGRGFRYGVPQSIVSGMYIGLEEGIVWSIYASNRESSHWGDNEVATTVWGLSTLGAVGGGILGSVVGTTPGRSSWVGSSALWTGTVAGLATGALAGDDDASQAALVAAGVGLTAGTGVGLATAAGVSPSIARVRFLDLGGLSGGLLVGGLYAAAANDDIDGRALAGTAALGALAGLGTAWALTSGMPEDRPNEAGEKKSALARMRPMLMPSKGGAMLGIGGSLD